MANKLFLIDGHALIFKMHYAFLRNPMINSKGVNTSILFGFTKYILEMIEREEPTHIAVAFDPPGGTFRNKMYTEYKANRSETPQLIIDALEPLQEICKAMHIPTLLKMGYEADDVIGSMAKKFEGQDCDVYMVTPDKDYGQLISEHIFQYRPGRSGGKDEIFDVKYICEKYGIERPEQVIDILTLWGDTADNVPGVDGVGEKGAGQLIGKYGSITEIYNHLDELTPKRRENFIKAKEHIQLSNDLVTIKIDIPIETTMEDMKLEVGEDPELANVFKKYEFTSLRRFLKEGVVAEDDPKVELNIKHVDADVIVPIIKNTKKFAFSIDHSNDSIYSPINSITLAVKPEEKIIYTTTYKNIEIFKEILEDKDIAKCGYELKLKSNILMHAGVELQGQLLDIELMHYLINPEQSHKPEILSQSLLGITPKGKEEEVDESNYVTGDLFGNLDAEDAGDAALNNGTLFGDNSTANENFSSKKTRKVKDSSIEDKIAEENAGILVLLEIELRKQMGSRGVDKLYDTMEEPLLKVLAKMERNGVKLDLAELKDFSKELTIEVQNLEEEIRKETGVPDLNVSSPKQVGEALFDVMKLDPKAKKSARGSYSTSEAVLSEIKHKHPVVEKILEFRAVKKLLSTYIAPFPDYVSPFDGKIHTTFNQALTATGRLSSSNPNLQNIPIRTERGKRIRKAFIPECSDNFIVAADYSQIELRIMAHMSEDEHMVESFKENKDIHSATAAKIFGISDEEVTKEERRIAKTANFGILYGISPFGLSQRLDISRAEAKKIITDYFDSFPAISDFIEKTIEGAKKNGYVETLFGRKRYLPEINIKNKTLKAIAERTAVNAPIQGTSADIIKLAMINTDRKMNEMGLKSKMVLQIHDELVFDVPKDELEKVKKLVTEEMENVIKLSIPLTVDCNEGHNWLEAH